MTSQQNQISLFINCMMVGDEIEPLTGIIVNPQVVTYNIHVVDNRELGNRKTHNPIEVFGTLDRALEEGMKFIKEEVLLIKI